MTRMTGPNYAVMCNLINTQTHTHTLYNLFVTHTFVYLEMSLFPSIFCTIAVLSLYGVYVVRFSLPDGVFLPREHGLHFLHHLM